MPKKSNSNWSLMYENQKGSRVPVIRRWAGDRYERHPVKLYKHLRDNPKELEDYVIRLNGKEPRLVRAKIAVTFKHAYISPDLLEHYREYLETQIPSRKHALGEFKILQKYVLNFFVGKMNLADPLEWHQNQETWAKSLLNRADDKIKDDLRLFEKKEIRSAKLIKSIVQAANRFIAYLHHKRPAEVPPLKFKPINHASYKDLEARRAIAADDESNPLVTISERKFIKDDDWKVIKKHLPDDIRSWTLLAYYYGLRRNEAMALNLKSVRKTHLKVEQQVIGLNSDARPLFGPTKGRASRDVPHWFIKPHDAYKLISDVTGYIHPDSVSKRWQKLMKKLKMDYTFHDLRHTYITKAMRVQEPRDVQLAVGHVNIQTTMAYLKDDRTMNDDVWTPTG